MRDVQMALARSSVLNVSVSSDRLFFGESGHGVARYDQVRYPIFTKLNNTMHGFFWKPIAIDVAQDLGQFNRLNESEQHGFTSNLRRQMVLDSIQGRAPSLAFLPLVTDSSLENCIQTWSFFETIHSESYQHIIRAIYPDPSVVINSIPDITQIVDCAASITRAYDEVIRNPSKESLYLALIAANALEGIRFYVSFAYNFSLSQRGLMTGAANIMKLIQRDEAQHLALVCHILKLLPKDDPDFVQIIGDLRPQAIAIFDEAAEQEKAWAQYLLPGPGILGVNASLMERYIDYLLVPRKHAAGLTSTAKSKIDHPFPWVERNYDTSSSQAAAQETEITSYISSSLENDLKEGSFSGISLDSL